MIKIMIYSMNPFEVYTYFSTKIGQWSKSYFSSGCNSCDDVILIIFPRNYT